MIVSVYSLTFFSMIGLLLNIILKEINMKEAKLRSVNANIDPYEELEEDSRLTESIIEIIATITNFCIVFSLYVYYDLWLTWSKTLGLFTQYDNIWNTGLWKSYCIELIINLIAPYHFFENIEYLEYNAPNDFWIKYSINDILLFFSFIRVYLPLKLVLFTTDFMSPRCQRLCAQNGCQADTMFAFKCIIKEKPYEIIITGLTISTVIFGYMLKIFEGPLTEVSGQDYDSLSSCMWNVVITLSSTGYGELYPRTFWGRVVGVIICFWGMFIVSMFVVTVTDLLEFVKREVIAFELLIKLSTKAELKVMATDMI